jgi:hypothetical protein
VTKSRNKNDNTTTFHHYKVYVFNVAIDQQLAELEDRFSTQAAELLYLSASLDLRPDRLLRLVLTLPVSTATTERCFSAMKLVKTHLRCTMGDEFLRDCLVLYNEKELAASTTGKRGICTGS